MNSGKRTRDQALYELLNSETNYFSELVWEARTEDSIIYVKCKVFVRTEKNSTPTLYGYTRCFIQNELENLVAPIHVFYLELVHAQRQLILEILENTEGDIFVSKTGE